MTRVALQIHRVGTTNPTGVHRYALSLAQALAATAADLDTVELWAGREPGMPSEIGGVPVHAWPLHRRLLHLSWALAKRPRADRFTGDVSVLHGLTPAVPLPTRRPLVVTVHDLFVLQHPQWYEPRVRWVVARAIGHAVEHAARIITPSDRVRLDLEEQLDVPTDRIAVVPEGVGGIFSRPVAPDEQAAVTAAYGVEPGAYFVTVGEIGPRKNLPMLFAALAAVREEPRILPLLVVGGDGMGAAHTKSLADELGVGHLVRFTGHVPDATLAALVQGARALVHPSFYEGFGLTPLEAMAAGTAVVSSSAGSLPEVVGDAGRLLDPADEAAWAGALLDVATDDDWVAQAVAAGHRRATQFTWTAAARRTWEVYEQVAAC